MLYSAAIDGFCCTTTLSYSMYRTRTTSGGSYGSGYQHSSTLNCHSTSLLSLQSRAFQCTITNSRLLPLGCAASFDVALTYGGPAVAIWGWVVVSVCVLCVSLNMAELSSAFPTSGGMYYWCFRLVGAKYAHFASWVAGKRTQYATMFFLGFPAVRFRQYLCLLFGFWGACRGLLLRSGCDS